MIITNLQECQGTQNKLQTATNEYNYTVSVGITTQKDVKKKKKELTLSNSAKQATTLLIVKLKTERTVHT